MLEEEKKAIERMEKVRDKNVHTFVDELNIVLNLIQKQQTKLEKNKTDIQRMQELLDLSDANNVKKDKIIHRITEYISTLDIEEDICNKTGKTDCDAIAFGECEECIKQYFERKVENE